MAVLKILGVLFAFMFLYILFLVVCSLFVDSKKEYEKHSKFYRVLLNGATSIAIKIMRIRLRVNGIEKIPPDTKNLLFVSNHRSNFDPIVTWYGLKAWKIGFISKPENQEPLFQK